jgi:hypothetical protein
MSNPIPGRFLEDEWTCLEVLGWIVDRDPELFGRLKSPEDVDRALLRDRVRYPPLTEAPVQALAYALREGKVTALDDDQTAPSDSWSGRNIDEALLFDREDVLNCWPVLEWLPLPNAAAAIMRHRGLTMPEAQAALIDLCVDGTLGARTPNLEIPAHWWLKAWIDGYSLRSLSIDEERPKKYRTGAAHELEDVQVSADDLRRWLLRDDGSAPTPASDKAIDVKPKRCSNNEIEKFIAHYFESTERPTQKHFVQTAVEANLGHKRDSLRDIYSEECDKRCIDTRRGRPRKKHQNNSLQ